MKNRRFLPLLADLCFIFAILVGHYALPAYAQDAPYRALIQQLRDKDDADRARWLQEGRKAGYCVCGDSNCKMCKVVARRVWVRPDAAAVLAIDLGLACTALLFALGCLAAYFGFRRKKVSGA